VIYPEKLLLIGRLAVALAIGPLIGLERGWERRELPEGQRAAGFRTFGMIGLLGGVTVQVGGSSQGLVLAVVAAAVSIFAALGYWREPWRGQDVSITSLIAVLLTFCLGALAGMGEMTAASSTAVVVTFLLGFKPELHRIIRRIERPELLATLRLLLISVVLLPVLPDVGVGPWQAFNPYRTWWMVVLVAGASYVGYFAIKVLGEKRGVLMTALCDGLVSSTAVTVSLARHAKDRTAVPDPAHRRSSNGDRDDVSANACGRRRCLPSPRHSGRKATAVSRSAKPLRGGMVCQPCEERTGFRGCGRPRAEQSA
jgi:hypothetical protein